MNNRSWIIVAVVAAILLLVVIVWELLSQQRTNPPAPPQSTTAAKNSTSSGNPASPGTPSTVVPHKPDLPPAPSKEQQMSNVLAVLNDAPINFYGKVIDQSNNPVSNVTVIATAAISKQWMEEKFDTHTTTTDGDGLFQFKGLHGMGLGINLKKEGYEFSSNKNSFTYSAMWPEKERHKPDANAPVIFKMWKLQGPQSLVKIGIGGYIPCNGTSVSFDLLTGKSMPSGGDLTVTFVRNPQNIQGVQKFAWKAVVQVNNGGLVDINDQYPNEAPTDGYQSQVIIDMPQDALSWFDSLNRSYYWKGRGGQYYGRFSVQIFAAFTHPNVPFTLSGYANPSGSRNLELAVPSTKE